MSDLFNGDYRELAAELGYNDKSFKLRQGKIISITNNYPSATTVGITLGNSSVTVTGVKYLKGYAPVVNDYVWVAQSGSDLLVIGSITRNELPFYYEASGDAVTVNAGPNTVCTLVLPAQTFPYRAEINAHVYGSGTTSGNSWELKVEDTGSTQRFGNARQAAAGGELMLYSNGMRLTKTDGATISVRSVISRFFGAGSFTTPADIYFNRITAWVWPI